MCVLISAHRSKRPKGLGVSMVGRLTAISEPVKNGPELMVILRVAHVSHDSCLCHIIVQVYIVLIEIKIFMLLYATLYCLNFSSVP